MTAWSRGGIVLLAVAFLSPFGLVGQDSSQTSPSGAALSAVAVPITLAPEIDGVMDEAFWELISPIVEFRQRVPVDGGPPSERTEVRIAYDQKAIYFGMIMYDSEPALIRNSILVREGRISQDDHVWIGLDTYHDRRNGYLFELNAFGTQSQARITEEGWMLEVAIPFTTIRFSAEDAPEMGVAFRRNIRRKNEEVFWPHIPARFRGGFKQVSQYATLDGLRDLPQGRYMELKPFAIIGAQKVDGETDTDVLDDIGVDFKYAITSNLTADLTWNTDFAQVEADNVQVNLTRFSLFFPEKREFFLERGGLFSFGDNRETEIFFSRRIGLSNEIIGGGRVTGQMGRLSVGMLSLQTDDAGLGDELVRGANNSVFRVRGDVLPRTTVGGIFTNLQNGDGNNRVMGADAQVRFWGGSAFSGWYAHVRDSDKGSSSAGSLKLDIRPQRTWVLGGEFRSVEADFAPGLGFVRRRDAVRYSGNVAWTPAFEGSSWARSLVSALSLNQVDGQDGVKQSSTDLIHNMFSFQSGERVTFNVRRQFEGLVEPASIRGRELGAGDYNFTYVDASITTNSSRTLQGRASVRVGDFWNGTRTDYSLSGSWKTGPHLTLTPSWRRNEIDLPVADGRFSTTVLGLNAVGAASRKLFANVLVQWDDVSRELQTNIRVDWIHTPGSDLFVVLNTGYQTGDLLDPRETRWLQRTGVVKLTYLKAF